MGGGQEILKKRNLTSKGEKKLTFNKIFPPSLKIVSPKNNYFNPPPLFAFCFHIARLRLAVFFFFFKKILWQIFWPNFLLRWGEEKKKPFLFLKSHGGNKFDIGGLFSRDPKKKGGGGDDFGCRKS